MEKPIIDEKRFQSLKKMMHSDDESLNLVRNIIHKCDMEKSFVHILLLIGEKYDLSYVFSTPLIKSKNLFDYLALIYGSAAHIPVSYNVERLIDLYKLHESHYNREYDVKTVKYIAKNYNSDSKDLVLTFGDKPLKPRKHGKKSR